MKAKLLILTLSALSFINSSNTSHTNKKITVKTENPNWLNSSDIIDITWSEQPIKIINSEKNLIIAFAENSLTSCTIYKTVPVDQPNIKIIVKNNNKLKFQVNYKERNDKILFPEKWFNFLIQGSELKVSELFSNFSFKIVQLPSIKLNFAKSQVQYKPKRIGENSWIGNFKIVIPKL